MLKPPRAACALLASGLLAACSRGPASSTAPAAAAPPASSQPPASPGPASPSTAGQPAAAPVQPDPASPASTVQPSSAPQATAPATPQPSAALQQPAPAAPQPPAPALPIAPILREVAAVGPGGAVTALARTGVTVVDPAATFRVELSVATSDARLVLLDAADALVAASSSREVGATTRLKVSPSVPLEPGGRYTLRLDGAVTRELHDASGKAYGPAALALRAAGQPPPPPEPKAKPKKRRR